MSILTRCIVVPGVLRGLASMYFHDVCSGLGFGRAGVRVRVRIRVRARVRARVRVRELG